MCVYSLNKTMHAFSLSLSLINSIVMDFNLLGFFRSLIVVVLTPISFTRAVDLDVDLVQEECPEKEGPAPSKV